LIVLSKQLCHSESVVILKKRSCYGNKIVIPSILIASVSAKVVEIIEWGRKKKTPSDAPKEGID